jgi:thiamine-monophosphate kinase
MTAASYVWCVAEASGGGEFAAIARIARRVGPAPPGEVWVGDDALVAGVHADLGLTSLADLGWKALAVNVSDVAAMGCVATRALVTISGASGAEVDALYDGLSAAATALRCPVVGGDLTGGDALVVSVSVLGDGRVDPGPVLRSGARAGDAIWVSGALGAAAAGLRALRAGRGTTP